MRIKTSQFLQLGKLKLWFNLNSGFLYQKNFVKTEGAYDLCGDGIHRVLFLDYDHFRMKEEWLLKQLEGLIEMFHIGNIYLFKTDETSYHAVCFDMFNTMEINQIISATSCDDAFVKNWKYDYTPRVLRLTEKGNKGRPQLINIIESPFAWERKKSRGHIKFYENLIPTFVPRVVDVRKAKKVGMWGIQYNTRSPEEKAKMQKGK